MKQIITSTAWCPKPGDRITVTNNPVVTIFLTAKGVRPLLLLLAGKAQCYPSSFLWWPLPLIAILLSVSLPSFKGAESLPLALSDTHRYNARADGHWMVAKDQNKVALSYATFALPYLGVHANSLCWRKGVDILSWTKYNMCFQLAVKLFGVWMCICAHLHVYWFRAHINLLEYYA